MKTIDNKHSLNELSREARALEMCGSLHDWLPFGSSKHYFCDR